MESAAASAAALGTRVAAVCACEAVSGMALDKIAAPLALISQRLV
jgi:hypothetical protein